jgi:hypothetical protein
VLLILLKTSSVNRIDGLNLRIVSFDTQTS